jgi:hypothetical protein
LNGQKRISAASQVGSRRGPARTAGARDVQLAGCASLEVLHSLSRGETIAAAVDGERQVEPEAADDETQARFDEATEQRFEKLRSQLDLTGRANAAFASAVGLDVSKIPPELLRELKQVADRMTKDELGGRACRSRN